MNILLHAFKGRERRRGHDNCFHQVLKQRLKRITFGCLMSCCFSRKHRNSKTKLRNKKTNTDHRTHGLSTDQRPKRVLLLIINNPTLFLIANPLSFSFLRSLIIFLGQHSFFNLI